MAILLAEHGKKSIPARSWYFISINFKLAFYQLAFEEQYQKHTTFTCQYGYFFFWRAPMGSCVSLDNFSRIADNALKDMLRDAYL